MRDRTQDKEKFAFMLKGWIDQFALSLANSDTKNYISQLVIEPFLQYSFQRMFPYLIITICIFSVILIAVILILVLLLMNNNSRCHFCTNAQ
jgi:predicted membrane metal-binding protein